jgi:peptidoglycan/xylan/chitin deacetylase (PgdA/CDA1 family)
MLRSDVVVHPDAWRRLAEAGHELGNHSIFHPCRMPEEPFPWLESCYNLCDYSPDRLRTELELANSVLHLIDGQTERSYANPCGDRTLGRGDAEQSIDGILNELFVAARGGSAGDASRSPQEIDLLNIGSVGADGKPLEALIARVEQGRAHGSWTVFVNHGVGADSHSLHADPEVHRQWVAWLAAQTPQIWVAPIREIARYVRAQP